MNKLTEEIKAMLRPKAALIAYENTDSNYYDNSYFLELRKIGDDGRMGEGMPVTFDFMNEIAAGYSEAHNGIPHGVIPQNMLYCDTRKGSEKYVWYNPSQKRMIFFRSDLNIEDGVYNLPGIVYVAGENSLMVYAYKGEVPVVETELFAAPFFNVSTGGVCLGSAKLEKPADLSFAQLLEYWEKKFWLTEFSHLGSSGNPTINNLVIVTKAAKDAQFNEDELKPANKTLKDLLK